ncbi:hypothetical protein CRG98_032420 [Punica granatum]|uniref:Iron-sulphur binding protein LdpA C-terminal domain-containing protein n=1 Tax=Punica granatum TaxID=22663 RepID=A0A2I0IT67_PUNGR|nr:hypothetical protein CRG98_032420 [Punica granatum]
MALSFCCTASVPPLQRVNSKLSGKKCLQEVKSLVKSLGIHSVTSSPVDSLRSGNWVKLICGASFEDVVDIRNLSLVYTLAGVDCIDCAADESVVGAVHEGIEVAREILPVRRPWVMISVNDDEDLHFRKAGVATYVRDAAATAELIHKNNVEAIEIHTSGRNISQFKSLWEGLEDSVRHLKLVAVSLPDLGDSTLSSMDAMYSIMEPRLQCLNLWQLDGRPMSGDIGRGATRESVAFAVRLAAIRDRPNGFLQLAGGTNAHTVNGLKKHGLFRTRSFAESSNNEEPKYSLLQALIGGVAYGGYARKIVGRILTSVQSQHGLSRIEDYPEHLLEAIVQAIGLVGTVKGYDVILDWK